MSATTLPRLIVDAMNVIGARADGWWRDPDQAKRRLVEQVRSLAISGEMRIDLVFDGKPIDGLPEGGHEGVIVHFAGHSRRDAADDLIVELVQDEAEPIRVVTSDRALRERAEQRGASVVGASWLLDQLDRLDS